MKGNINFGEKKHFAHLLPLSSLVDVFLSIVLALFHTLTGFPPVFSVRLSPEHTHAWKYIQSIYIFYQRVCQSYWLREQTVAGD